MNKEVASSTLLLYTVMVHKLIFTSVQLIPPKGLFSSMYSLTRTQMSCFMLALFESLIDLPEPQTSSFLLDE